MEGAVTKSKMENTKPLPWSDVLDFGEPTAVSFLGLALALGLCPAEDFDKYRDTLLYRVKGRRQGYECVMNVRLRTPYGVVHLIVHKQVVFPKDHDPALGRPTWVQITGDASRKTLRRIIDAYFSVKLEIDCHNWLSFTFAMTAYIVAQRRGKETK